MSQAERWRWRWKREERRGETEVFVWGRPEG